MATYALRINGRTHQVEGEPDDSLLSVLRYELDLTGSKFGCGEGACGACTVLVDDLAARSCVTRLAAVAGKSITTIEGLGGDRVHPVQQAFLDAEAFQCGYCTPGMVMAAVSLIEEGRVTDERSVREGLEGNLCRCTGYHNIVKAVQAAAGGAK